LSIRYLLPFSPENMERRFFATQQAWQEPTERGDLSLAQL
jgi:hypothetical protein